MELKAELAKISEIEFGKDNFVKIYFEKDSSGTEYNSFFIDDRVGLCEFIMNIKVEEKGQFKRKNEWKINASFKFNNSNDRLVYDYSRPSGKIKFLYELLGSEQLTPAEIGQRLANGKWYKFSPKEVVR